MSRQLVFVRHGEAEAGGVRTADRERALTGNGRAQAQAAGSLLARSGVVCDHVLCSTAVRARQTLELALPQMARTPVVDYDSSLYGAAPETVLELVSVVPADVTTLAVVGHNPAMAQLVAAFTGNGGPVAFAPASVAVATVDQDWLYVTPEAGTAQILG
ncbi:phosphohistidine phosphatase [Haloactinospora alba]|uniref:Phosphohistidine phosphatase n=1 Tax=Haloactinospora alba TaxID=405555 RepID=A0A543NA72_9ACTN|nr:histidine phosphatase family protein [Haloactinospora alba]TQN28720.1 phosphohistidine phosphatase [Haloactinospora alba]